MARPLATKWIDVVQGTEEWHHARKGMPTASRFSDVLASSKELKVRTAYLHDLAAEIITGEPVDTFSNYHMERGRQMEAEIRMAYELVSGATCEPVGFATNGIAGASPDSRTGPRSGIEIKTQIPRLLIGRIRKREFPVEHYAQCQGVMWVCDWDEVELIVGWPKIPLFRWTVERDAKFIANLEDEVRRFNRDLKSVVAQVRAYGRR